MFGDAPLFVVAPGEPAKSLAGLERVLDFLADQKIDRGGVLFAVGGGVIGDLGGFAAASNEFRRGALLLKVSRARRRR